MSFREYIAAVFGIAKATGKLRARTV